MKSIITKVEVQKNNKDRVNIYINENYAFSCSTELVYNYSIKKDKEIDEEYLKEYLKNIIEEDNYIKGKTSALRFIERSFKTETQVYDNLIKKGYEIKTIDRVMCFLKEYNFIDDDKYVLMYVKDKIKLQGKNKIKYNLIKKGISEEKIIENLKNIDFCIERETALKLGEKKYKVICKSEKDNNKAYKKLADYLYRSGFEYEIINETINKVVSYYNENMNEDINKDGVDYNEVNLEERYNELYNTAIKRYDIVIKSEKNESKIYKKLSDYLLRRGYKWEEIKKVLKDIIQNIDNANLD